MVGKGITTLYHFEGLPNSLEEIQANPLKYVELGNLIHVYGQEQNNEIVSIPNPGFEVGIGLGRLCIAKTKKTLYNLQPLSELAGFIDKHFSENVKYSPALSRFLADHIQVIDLLISNGVKPGSQKQSYVLRKAMRNVFEKIVLLDSEINFIKVKSFFLEIFLKSKHILLSDFEEYKNTIEFEIEIMSNSIQSAKKALEHEPIDESTLLATYGVRKAILPYIKN